MNTSTPFSKAVRIVSSWLTKGARERQDWDKWHSWYLGNWSEGVDRDGEGDDDDEGGSSLETNLPFEFVDTMVANVCPSNPMTTITGKGGKYKEPAKVREQLVNDTLRQDKMAAKGWDLATFTAICGRGVSKTVWNSKKGRPQTYLVDPRFFFYDMSREFEDTRYCCEAIPITKDEFDLRLADKKYDAVAGKDVKGGAFPEWMKDSSGEWYVDDESREVFEWVIVYEFYDFINGQLFHFIEGAEKPLLAGTLPYVYMRNPYTLTMFNKNLRSNSGLSDMKLIEKPLERMNELDTLELHHARTSVPVPIVNKNAFVDPQNAEAQLELAGQPGALAVLELHQEYRDIRQVIMYSQAPGMNPSWEKSRDRAYGIAARTLGLADYARGEYGGAKVATELALVDTASQTRNGKRVTIMQDWILEVSKRILAIWKQYLDPKRTIHVLPKRSAPVVDVDRINAAFPEIKDGVPQPESFDDEWYYLFEASAYSPTANHKLIVLQKLQQFIQILARLPGVDVVALTHKLLELLGLDDVKSDGAQPQAQPPPGAQPGQPGTPGAPGVSGAPADPIVPPGPSEQTVAMLPPGVNPNASLPTA